MKIFSGFLLCLFLVSCGRKNESGSDIITVSIAPFKYFVESIAGDNFSVNVMVPAGANPHIYEPFPEQVNRLRKSVAYISNGFLGFEMTWLDRFYEINKNMKKLSLGSCIEPIEPERHDDIHHIETADPHYWVSPMCAISMARAVYGFLVELDPGNKELYGKNLNSLLEKISELDLKAKELASQGKKNSFMIYHPNLAYLARDYGLDELPVEFEGKEPDPSRLMKLIDQARNEKLKVILVQREYDTKNARAVADEVGAKVVIIDPLAENWYSSTDEIISILKASFEGTSN